MLVWIIEQGLAEFTKKSITQALYNSFHPKMKRETAWRCKNESKKLQNLQSVTLDRVTIYQLVNRVQLNQLHLSFLYIYTIYLYKPLVNMQFKLIHYCLCIFFKPYWLWTVSLHMCKCYWVRMIILCSSSEWDLLLILLYWIIQQLAGSMGNTGIQQHDIAHYGVHCRILHCLHFLEYVISFNLSNNKTPFHQ